MSVTKKYKNIKIKSNAEPAITHKIFRTSLFFKSFLLALTKLSFWQGDWGLGYHSMGIRHFPDVS